MRWMLSSRAPVRASIPCSRLHAAMAVCALSLAACAHTPPPAPAKPDRTRELGVMKVVPVAAVPEGRAHSDKARPTMALSEAELAAHPSANAPKPSAEMLPPAEARSAQKQPKESEVQLRERVQRALLGRKSLSYTAQRVSVAVARRDVTLRGDVPTEREKGEVQHVVENIEGVRRVHNQLAVIDHRMMPAPDALH